MLDRMKKDPMSIGCFIYGVILLVGVLVFGIGGGLASGVEGGEDLESLLGGASCLLFLSWLGGSVPGIIILFQKRYFTALSGAIGGIGCIAMLLLGVVTIPLMLVIWIATGPLIWLVAILLPPRTQCPNCTKIVPRNATKCPHCGGEIK